VLTVGDEGPETLDTLQRSRAAVSAPWERQAGGQEAPAAGLGIQPSVLLTWFAAAAELLGDVIRLAWHWHEVDRRREAGAPAAATDAAAFSGGVRGEVLPAMQQQGGFSRDVAELLSAADWAICRLAQAIGRQAVTGRAAGLQPNASLVGVQQSHSSSSLHDLAGAAAEAAVFGGGGGAYGAGQIDLVASMEALALMMMRPPANVDEVFTLMRERSGHVLSGGIAGYTFDSMSVNGCL
jgi:hypothetical protein